MSIMSDVRLPMLRVAAAVLFVMAVDVRAADELVATEHAITSSGGYNTSPTLGADAVGKIVVYTTRVSSPAGYGPGTIMYQRLDSSGAPSGAPVTVSVGTGTDDELNDVSGNNIVYIAFDSISSAGGRIILYEISTSSSVVTASASVLRRARIHGGRLAWVQGSAATASAWLYDVALLGTGTMAIHVAGPGSLLPPAAPPAQTVGSVEIGDRFMVWDQRPSAGTRDVYAFDLVSGAYHAVAVDSGLDERDATTAGPWVVWESQTPGTTHDQILALNLDTGERRVVADNGALSYAPTISGNVITYESNVAGNYDIYVYRLDEGDTFWVTTDTADQRLNNVFGDLVAYVDRRTGSYEVYVSKLEFVEPDSCALLGGDADGDGVCQYADNCPAAANADQADGDDDGAGDVCDSCPADPFDDVDGDGTCGDVDNCAVAPNPGQEDADGDGYGDACDVCPVDSTNSCPPVEVSPSSYDFGAVVAFTQKSTCVNVTNPRSSAIRITPALTSGTTPPFSIDLLPPADPAGYPLAPGEAFCVPVVFAPTEVTGVSNISDLTIAAGSPPVIVASVPLAGTAIPGFGEIEVAPASLALGDVELGSSAAGIVTISNLSERWSSPLLASFLNGSSPEFSFSCVAPTLCTCASGACELVLAPLTTADLEVRFAPTVAGSASATLVVSVTDQSSQVSLVSLTGTGVYVPTPADVVRDILAFFDDSVADGTLNGSGPGASAGGRLGAMENMIKAAGDLLAQGQYARAAAQLLDAYRRVDGMSPPPDFVAGPAAAELRARIVALRASILTPTLAVDQSQRITDRLGMSGGTLWGQTFVPSATNLTQVDLLFMEDFLSPEGMTTTVGLYRDITQAPIATTSATMMPLAPGVLDGIVSFRFDPPVSLQPGTPYAIGWYGPRVSPSGAVMSWEFTFQNPYANGQAVDYANVPINPPADFVFTTYYVP